MSEFSRRRLKSTIASALLNIDDMKQDLAIIRDQCKLLEEEMRAIRVRSKRARIHAVPPNRSHLDASEVRKNSA
ncbi:MAG TPA: hypothetical protein DIC30_10550 [Oceanospirillales bacterium]|nr:hypothetical protein [Oceanospirillales bacterium]|tara:strand:- start:2600 stop:2821 length:222 start_codon:yes stop_codon:yes gene_type:complete